MDVWYLTKYQRKGDELQSNETSEQQGLVRGAEYWEMVYLNPNHNLFTNITK